MNELDPQLKRFEVSVAIRNFEIELFWKRSVFFWGFIASAFVGYAALRDKSAGLSIVVACFGMVCSFAWALLNRGSRYWQESWEKKVESAESAVTGRLFAHEEEIDTRKVAWLRARRYSVSKIATALSDYVFVLWMCLVGSDVLRFYAPECAVALKTIGLPLFVGFSVLYLGLIAYFGRKTKSDAKPS
jgi:hypothetical protein